MINERNGESTLPGNTPKKRAASKYMKGYSTALGSKNAKDNFSKRLAKSLKSDKVTLIQCKLLSDT